MPLGRDVVEVLSLERSPPGSRGCKGSDQSVATVTHEPHLKLFLDSVLYIYSPNVICGAVTK